MSEENVSQSENLETAQSVTQTPVVPTQTQKKKSKKLVVYISLFIITIIVVIAGIYLLITSAQKKTSQNPTAIKSVPTVRSTVELSTRTYFSKAKPTQVLREESIKSTDGSLETIVTKDGKKLSHQLFLKDKILSLSNGVLTQQTYKNTPRVISYKTTGENFLDQIRKNPNLSKKTVVIDGKKVTIYTIGDLPKAAFGIIKSVYADSDNNGVTKIYISEDDKELKKVENVVPGTDQITEEIVYENGPRLDSILPEAQDDKVAIDALKTSINEVSIEPSEEPQASITPTSFTEEQLRKEAGETKEIVVDAPEPISLDEAITLFPLSAISTEIGYTNKYADLVSKVFKIYELEAKSLEETGAFDPDEFVSKNIKVKIDGEDVSIANFNITVSALYRDAPDGASGLIRFGIPPGLSPGYHTVQVFVVDSWYLAPSLMVVEPQSDENILTLELYSTVPPTAVPLSDGQGSRLSLTGKNLVKPFSVIFTDTQGKEFPLEDSRVEVVGSEELILTLPPAFVGIYSLTITKGSQTIYRPNYIAVSAQVSP